MAVPLLSEVNGLGGIISVFAFWFGAKHSNAQNVLLNLCSGVSPNLWNAGN